MLILIKKYSKITVCSKLISYKSRDFLFYLSVQFGNSSSQLSNCTNPTNGYKIIETERFIDISMA